MKLLHELLIFSFCFTTSFLSLKNPRDLMKKDDCRSILDSATILIQTSEWAVNTKPTIKDQEKNLRIDKWLQKQSFENLTCLLENDNVALKVLGFVYAANLHRDSLFNNYSYLLRDTTTVQLFMADGTSSPKIKLGELLSGMAQTIKEDKDNFAKRPEVEGIVSAFIRQYSTYPNSYKPIAFPYFSMGSDNKGVSGFNIRHDYEIKNNAGKIVRVVSAFVLDKNLKINVIEKDSTSYSYSYPPKLDYWLKEFGRKLNKNDSLLLKLR